MDQKRKSAICRWRDRRKLRRIELVPRRALLLVVLFWRR